MNKLAVIALGGNALLRGDQEGTIEQQEQNTTDTLENLVFLLNFVGCLGSYWTVGRKRLREEIVFYLSKLDGAPLKIG